MHLSGRFAEVLTPGTCECDLIWRQGLCGCEQVESHLIGEGLQCSVTGVPMKRKWGLSWGSVAKSPPANAGDTTSFPGPGGSHVPLSNSAHATQLGAHRNKKTQHSQKNPPELRRECGDTGKVAVRRQAEIGVTLPPKKTLGDAKS